MRFKIKVYRAAKVPAKFIVAAVGADTDSPPDVVKAKLVENFAPMAPGIALYAEGNKYVITKEIMAFDIRQAGTPFAATMVECDPLLTHEIHRADGALESELNRMGITTDPKDYEWRSIVIPEGN